MMKTAATSSIVLALCMATASAATDEMPVPLSTATGGASTRYAILIGNDRGAPGEVPLLYAEDDAQKMADTLRTAGGFNAEDIVVLRGESVSAVRRVLITMNDRIRSEAASADDRALLFVYYSGHASSRALHIGGEELGVEELEGLVRGSSASFRILVVDACRSGAITNVKGARPSAPFDLPSSSPTTSEGYVVLTAAAAGEDAQESTSLRGSFFTHHLVSGLLGAADASGDARVTLSEAYEYAFHQTVRSSSVTLAGTQHPTFRYDLRGRGEIVLTTLSVEQLSELALPAGVDVLVFDNQGRVVGEVPRDAPRRTLFVVAGRYVVHGRTEDALLDGSVDVAAGETRQVSEAELERTEYARLVRKGGTSVRAAVVGPSVSYAGHTGWAELYVPCNGVSVSAPVVATSFAVAPRFSVCGTAWQNEVIDALGVESTAEVVLFHTFDFDVVSVDVGGFAGVSWMHEEFETRGSAPPHNTVFPVYGGLLGLEVPLTGQLFGNAALEIRSGFPVIDFVPASTTVLGWRAGVGAYF